MDGIFIKDNEAYIITFWPIFFIPLFSAHFSVELTNGFQFLEGRRIAIIQTRNKSNTK
jgi:hypothetical protein